jgi:EAL domain-containing protein (putative c-di-GMP-specific phosphodiesterase class I)
LAEDTGLISQMGKQVIEEACSQIQRWKSQSYLDVQTEISVNISAKQFHKPEELIEDIQIALEKTGLSPDQLLLEITESMIMGDVDYDLDILRRLKSLGVQISIDDFGTGYSNLAYLKNFPVDVIKVDQSFVSGLETSLEDRSIVEAVIGLARALSLRVIAEGIETTGQMEELMALGCELGQGYYFSKPLSAEQTTVLLAERLRTSPLKGE